MKLGIESYPPRIAHARAEAIELDAIGNDL